MNVLLRILFRLLFLTFSGLGVSHIQRIGYQSERIALHGSQSRSCSAGHGKQDKNRKSGNPPPQTLIVRKKTNKTKRNMVRTAKRTKWADGQRGHHVAHLHACLGATQVSVRLTPEQDSFDSFYASVYDHNFSSLVASLFSWRSLAASISSFLHAAINVHPPSGTASTHTSASNAVASQSSALPNARMSLRSQSDHFFSFPPRPLRTIPSRFCWCI